MLLHKECLPAQLAEPLEQAVIAATFNDCNGDPLAPDTQLAKCSDIPAAQTLSISGQTLTIAGGNSVTLPVGTDAQTLSISGQTLTIAGGNSVTLPAGAAQVPQVLSLYNDVLTLSNGGGSVTLADSDSQTLDLQGNTLSISNGNSVTLPAGTAASIVTAGNHANVTGSGASGDPYIVSTEFQVDYNNSNGCEAMSTRAVGSSFLARSLPAITNNTTETALVVYTSEVANLSVQSAVPTYGFIQQQQSLDGGATWTGHGEALFDLPNGTPNGPVSIPFSTIIRPALLAPGATLPARMTRVTLISNTGGSLGVMGCTILNRVIKV